MDIEAWLRGLGLERYVPAFRENEIDWEVLPKLTSEDLREIGVAAVGHRRKLLDAIAVLGASAPTAAMSAAVSGASARADAERRQLTVMFCDLVGSTPLSARLDPEDLRGIFGAYHRCVTEIVESFGGLVARYMGDGVLVYFGYPQAHEDDAERATRCGLVLVDRVPQLDQTEKLHARVGIATGLVVVGDLIGAGPAQEQSVVGETPNLAARLQTLAEPDTVVIAAGTRRLVGDLFEYRDLGAIEVKGIARPVSAWQVLRPSAVESRFEALRGAALSPLIGRDEEIELLLRRWARAKAGDGQVVLISGEPGIGKSRLTAALAEQPQTESHIRLRYFCSPYYQDSALFPFVDQLGRRAGFALEDSPAVKLEKLETLLARAVPADEDVALIADLLSLPASERHPLHDLSPQRKKERTLEALLCQLEGLSRQQPVVTVFEDVHWIDPTSRELLDLTIERVRGLPVLLVVTFRPEFQPPWTGEPHVTVLSLTRLNRHEQTALIAQTAGGKMLPQEVVDQIIDRTDGMPLFIEELTKSVLEGGLLREQGDRYVLDRAVPLFAIPTSLHDSLMARLDRLASVRLVAQIGAAIGREFSYDLLRAVSRLPEDELEASLGRLVGSELVFQRGTPPEAVYSFKHALVQEAAHSSLLRSSRRQLHAQIASALETHSPALIHTQPELLAQHYAEAGLVEQAVAYWGKAGHRSAAQSAMTEAVAQFHKALDQLSLLPETPKHQRQELELRSGLGAALISVKGQAAVETGYAYARARELWEQLGSPSEFLHVPAGQSRNYVYCGELDLALRLDESLLRLSRERKDSAGLILGHHSAGRDLMLAGRFRLSRSHLEQVLALYDPISHRSLTHRTGHDPHANSQALLGVVLLCLGYPEKAMARSNAAITEARRLGHQPSLISSLTLVALHFTELGDDTALGERLDELAAAVAEGSYPFLTAAEPMRRGWLKVKNGDPINGMPLLRSGAAASRSTGSVLWRPYYCALLARACEIAGQIEEATALFDEGWQIVQRTGERWFAAELNRLKGELLLRQGDLDAAEELYYAALETAREQEAKLWELRAAMSLARMRADQGRRAEARDLLPPVYGWFTEGFNTADLTEAKALLDELT